MSRRLDPKDLGRAFARGPRTQIDFLLPPRATGPAPAPEPGPEPEPAPGPAGESAATPVAEAGPRRRAKKHPAEPRPRATRRRKAAGVEPAGVEPAGSEAQEQAARVDPPVAVAEAAVAGAAVEPPVAVAVAEAAPPGASAPAPPVASTPAAVVSSTETTSTLESSTRIQRLAPSLDEAPPLETSSFSRTLAAPPIGWSPTGEWGAIPAPPALEPTFEEEVALDWAGPPIEIDSVAALLAAPFEAELELSRLRSQVLARPASAPAGPGPFDPAVGDLDWAPGVPPLQLGRGLRARLGRGLDRVLARGLARLLGRVG